MKNFSFSLVRATLAASLLISLAGMTGCASSSSHETASASGSTSSDVLPPVAEGPAPTRSSAPWGGGNSPSTF